MKLYKRSSSSSWYVSYYYNGTRIRKSLDTTNRKQAEALVAKLQQELFLEENFDKKPDKAFEDALLKYLTGDSKLKKSHKTDIEIAKVIRPHFCSAYLSQITPSLIKDYIDERRSQDIKESTIIRELALVKVILNKAHKEWEWIDSVPTFPRLSANNERTRWLTKEEKERLIAACPEHLQPIVITAFETGGRIGEILNLKWNDVSFEHKVLRFMNTKNGQPRSIPMTDRLIGILPSLKNKTKKFRFCFTFKDKPIKSIKKSFITACKKAGIEDFRIHDMRHTFASHLIQNGVSLIEVKELLGHKSLDMVMRYAHLAPDNLRSAINKLNIFT